MSTQSGDWAALDAFRGIAALAMIANHAAVRWVHPIDAHSLSSAAFWIGGLAPVLFFFASGFGAGLQHAAARGGAAHRYGFAAKVIVLCIADQFSAGVDGRFAARVDFLSFIGLSMLVLEPLRGMASGRTVAEIGVVLVIAARFGLPGLLGNEFDPWIGQRAVPWNSYPPLPWLAFPLLGFALGARAAEQRAALAAPRSLWALLAIGAMGLAASALLASLGFSVNRYGKMTLAYVPIAFGAIAVVGAVALAWERRGLGPFGRFLALRGLASLLLVPLHFLMIAALAPRVAPAEAAVFAAALVAVSASSLAAARALARFGEREARGARAVALAWVCVAVAGAAALWAIANPPATPALRDGILFAGCAAFCLLLVLPLRPKRAAA